jgi:hypothetical protein
LNERRRSKPSGFLTLPRSIALIHNYPNDSNKRCDIHALLLFSTSSTNENVYSNMEYTLSKFILRNFAHSDTLATELCMVTMQISTDHLEGWCSGNDLNSPSGSSRYIYYLIRLLALYLVPRLLHTDTCINFELSNKRGRF